MADIESGYSPALVDSLRSNGFIGLLHRRCFQHDNQCVSQELWFKRGSGAIEFLTADVGATYCLFSEA